MNTLLAAPPSAPPAAQTTITLRGQHPYAPHGHEVEITLPYRENLPVVGDRYKQLIAAVDRASIWVPLAGDFNEGDRQDMKLLFSFLWPLLAGKANLCLTHEPPKFRKDYRTLLVCRTADECSDSRANKNAAITDR